MDLDVSCIDVRVGKTKGNCSLKLKKFGQNQNFSRSEKELFS